MDEMYEKFEVSDWDLKNENNPKRFRQSKKQTIYGMFVLHRNYNDLNADHLPVVTGVFASDSESDGEDRTKDVNFKMKKKNVSFVSASDEQEDVVPEQPSSSKPRNRPARSFAGLSGQFHQTQNIGKWQKHTSGIGAKLLNKMGWEPGKGLGKNEQGITVPIEAAVRSVIGSGIGAAGPEHKQEALLPETRDNSAATSSNYSSSSSKEKVKKNYVFKTVDDLINDEIGMGTSFSDTVINTKIVDMRGPDSKVLTSVHEIFAEKSSEPTDETEKEILGIEKQLVKNGREIRKARERLEVLDEDKKHVEIEMRSESERLERLTDLISIISKLNARYNEDRVKCHDLILIYSTFVRNFYAEVNQFQLHDMLSPLILNVISSELRDWDLFSSPAKHKELFCDLQRLLLEHNSELYDRILWDVWTALFRRQFLNLQSLKEPEPVIAFLETWQLLLPQWLMNNLMEQIVIPRLGRQVDEWDPLTDPVPVHSWIHPWLHLMDGHSLESLYASIRNKLGQALSMWHPSDISAKIILQPWKNVMTDA